MHHALVITKHLSFGIDPSNCKQLLYVEGKFVVAATEIDLFRKKTEFHYTYNSDTSVKCLMRLSILQPFLSTKDS